MPRLLSAERQVLQPGQSLQQSNPVSTVTIVLAVFLGVTVVLMFIISFILWKSRRSGRGDLGVEMTGQ